MDTEKNNGLAILIIAGIIFPPLGAFLILVGVVVIVFAFFDWIIGSLFETKVPSFIPDETPEFVPDLWSKDR